MRLRSARLQVTSTLGLPPGPGAWLQIGEDEDADQVQVRSARGSVIKIGRVYWWHRALWWLRLLPGRVGWFLRRQWCAAAGHRFPADGVTGLRHCRCCHRWEDNPDWDDDEDGCG